MNTNEKGNLGYAEVIVDVVRKGYFPFTPFTDTTSVDLIIGNNKMELKKVQIKYRKKDKFGVITIPTTSVVNGKKIQVDVTTIDLWAIYCPDTNKVYYIDSLILKNKKTLNLRIDKPKLNIKTLFAHNFENLNF